VKPVDQRNRYDCLQACVASIFELPYDQVPQFGESAIGTKREALQQDTDFRNWLDRFGISHSYITNPEIMLEAGKSARAPWGLCVGEGTSPRGKWFHATVWDARGTALAIEPVLLWDPHPDRTGLKGRVQQFTCFNLEDPAKLARAMLEAQA